MKSVKNAIDLTGKIHLLKSSILLYFFEETELKSSDGKSYHVFDSCFLKAKGCYQSNELFSMFAI